MAYVPHNGAPTKKAQYTLGYGMRLDKGTGTEFAHPHVSVTLPNGSVGSMAIHVINGTPDEIKARLLESVDAFFEIHAEQSAPLET
ncbi:hypothetical protein [Nitrospira sp. Nam80]